MRKILIILMILGLGGCVVAPPPPHAEFVWDPVAGMYVPCCAPYNYQYGYYGPNILFEGRFGWHRR